MYRIFRNCIITPFTYDIGNLDFEFVFQHAMLSMTKNFLNLDNFKKAFNTNSQKICLTNAVRLKYAYSTWKCL